MAEGEGTLRVEHVAGDRFRIAVRGHELTVDQPVESGGEDLAPTPTEMFVAGLASCVGFFGARYLVRHGLSTEGLAVDCRFSFASDRPSRVASVDLRIEVPAGLPEAQRERFMAVVEHCTVHNSIQRAPEVRIRLEEGATKAA